MQRLHTESISEASAAGAVVDAMPLLMHFFNESRRRTNVELSFLQLRMLGYISRHAGVSLSALNEYLGVTLPSTSRHVDYLVRRGYVRREVCASDRRLVQLGLTAPGGRALEQARRESRTQLAARLETLSAPECATVIEAMGHLQRLFSLEPSAPHREPKVHP
jgi:DNA-binding MarR family transcriptional regulator